MYSRRSNIELSSQVVLNNKQTLNVHKKSKTLHRAILKPDSQSIYSLESVCQHFAIVNRYKEVCSLSRNTCIQGDLTLNSQVVLNNKQTLNTHKKSKTLHRATLKPESLAVHTFTFKNAYQYFAIVNRYKKVCSLSRNTCIQGDLTLNFQVVLNNKQNLNILKKKVCSISNNSLSIARLYVI